jgi:hypothetical protein
MFVEYCRQVLEYGQSEYVREFGMIVSQDPVKIQARQLKAPMLKYGVGSKQLTIVSRRRHTYCSSMLTLQIPDTE